MWFYSVIYWQQLSCSVSLSDLKAFLRFQLGYTYGSVQSSPEQLSNQQLGNCIQDSVMGSAHELGHQLQPHPARLLQPLISHANRFPCFGHSSLLIQPSCLVHLYSLQVNPAKFLCCSTCHTAYNIQQCNFANPVLSALLPCLVNPIAKNCTQGFCQDLPLFCPLPSPLSYGFN